jgi:hypothetical protein
MICVDLSGFRSPRQACTIYVWGWYTHTIYTLSTTVYTLGCRSLTLWSCILASCSSYYSYSTELFYYIINILMIHILLLPLLTTGHLNSFLLHLCASYAYLGTDIPKPPFKLYSFTLQYVAPISLSATYRVNPIITLPLLASPLHSSVHPSSRWALHPPTG